jgi:transaldolase
MTKNTPLRQLNECGQSAWLDSLGRDLLRSGKLAQLIQDDGVSGVTDNPTIFQKAIVGSDSYDDSIRGLAASGAKPMHVYEALLSEDVAAAADLFQETYRLMGGADGFASIEVSPELAYDTQGTIDEARRFWNGLHRQNVMIKVPATAEGIPAIEELTFEGVNVNITLIFSVERYEQVMQAYLRGLKRRIDVQQPISGIASVASFFVSRVDTLVDEIIDKKLDVADGATRAKLRELKGKAAVANAKIAYERFERVFSGENFLALRVSGAQTQRPLWASTGTKNPAYPDTLYVSSLVGPQTVNTMPPETLDAFRDHGEVRCRAICDGVDKAHAFMADLRQAGIDMKDVTDRLTTEGVDKFSASLQDVVKTIEKKMEALVTA